MVNGKWVYDYGKKSSNALKAAKNYQKMSDEAHRDASGEAPVTDVLFVPDRTESKGYRTVTYKDYSYIDKKDRQAYNYHKLANTEYSISESAKRMQQSALAAEQRAKAKQEAAKHPIKTAISKYTNKGKNTLRKLGIIK